MSEEFRSISELKKLLSSDCKVEKVYPPVFGSDAEVNIVTVTVRWIFLVFPLGYLSYHLPSAFF
ncbi:MAG TPA: hypothetical protein VE593_11610, partial [Nitrososphaeraceae archaeon]|nr:hypothetical protein [Nitrososphaeraceae archaeon]